MRSERNVRKTFQDYDAVERGEGFDLKSFTHKYAEMNVLAIQPHSHRRVNPMLMIISYLHKTNEFHSFLFNYILISNGCHLHQWIHLYPTSPNLAIKSIHKWQRWWAIINSTLINLFFFSNPKSVQQRLQTKEINDRIYDYRLEEKRKQLEKEL